MVWFTPTLTPQHVNEDIPLKEGLKLLFILLTLQFKLVNEDIPLKEGLKRTQSSIPFITWMLLMKIFH